jgi:hypothetical protein
MSQNHKNGNNRSTASEPNETTSKIKLSLDEQEETALSLFFAIQEYPDPIDVGESLHVETMADACRISREDLTMVIEPRTLDDLWYEITYDPDSQQATLNISVSEGATRDQLEHYHSELEVGSWSYNENNYKINIFEQEWSIDPKVDHTDAIIEEIVHEVLDTTHELPRMIPDD